MPLSPPKRFSTPKAGNRAEECEDDSRVVYPAGQYGLEKSQNRHFRRRQRVGLCPVVGANFDGSLCPESNRPNQPN